MQFDTHTTSKALGAGFITAVGALGLLLGPGALAGGGGGGGGGMDDPAERTLELRGKVRDFNERTHPSGHPDFERRPNAGFGQYCANVASILGPDGKPIFSGMGWKLTSDWRDDAGRPICHLLYDPTRGDTQGSRGVSDQGGIESAASFRTWFNDEPGVNISKPLTLTFHYDDDRELFVFDDKEDPYYSDLGGFFPLEGELFGNPGGSPDRNFHLTFELHTEFKYDHEAKQVFRFIGDDDVWVYIDGQLVIDLGGVHSAKEQYVDLSRLGLETGETYALDFFFAERHRTQSNFRIETNLLLQSIDLPSVSAAFD